MAPTRDRILIVENDGVVADLIGRQVLQASGYQTFIVGDATAAIAKALQWSPDLIITDLNLPGLSGKDLMIALSSQGITTPVILLAPKGQEQVIIQTFRVGAADFLLQPVREAEVLAATERVLKQVHERRERDRLAQQLQQTNQELQLRVRELTTIFAVGKAVTSITDINLLLEKVLEGAVRVAQADLGWFLMRDDLNKPFVLAATHNLPGSLGVQVGQVWDDGISSLVAMSGEMLTLQGEPLRRFKISSLGQAAMIAPIKVQKNVVGLLVLIRKAAAAFSPSEQHLLDAVADHASISLVNAYLFRSVDERARVLQAVAENAQVGDWIDNELLRAARKEMGISAAAAQNALNRLAKDPTARWRPDQRQWMSAIQAELDKLNLLGEQMLPAPAAAREAARANLAEQVALAARRAQPAAQAGGITFQPDLARDPGAVALAPLLLGKILDGLFSNALKFSAAGGQISLRVEKNAERQVVLGVANSSAAFDPKNSARIFDAAFQPDPALVQRWGGLGIRLNVIKEILQRHGGKIWVEPAPGKGVVFYVAFQQARG